MKASIRFGCVMTAFAATLLLGACSSTSLNTAKTDTVAPKPQPDQPKPPCCAPQPEPVKVRDIAPYLDPKNPLSQKRSVYFDFDQYTLKPEYTPILEMHGKYLAAHTEVNVKVQGNTDEQGGAEYNLALGQKRAEAVVKALKIYGVKESQLEAVSFGKEKPRAMGHDDAARAENRRADLAYPEK